MKKLLMLYGVNCTKEIWSDLVPYMKEYKVDYVEYPHDVTMKANDVETLTKWVYETYHANTYDAVVGHSLGGIIALQLVAQYGMKFDKIIYLDTNLKPANEFYRNLLTEEHMEAFGDRIIPMFQSERQFYTKELFESIQDEFDYSGYLKEIPQKVYAIYGDRDLPEYLNKINDLNLSNEALKKLDIIFIEHACHMIMNENPKQLAKIFNQII